MSKKVSRQVQDAETDDKNRIFVQVRLPAALGQRLREEGEKHNRKLPSEIIHRLQQESSAGSADALTYGWIDPSRNAALGQAIGHLAARLEMAGPMTQDRAEDRAGVLGMLKLAIGEVLDRLGADETILSADERNFASLEARKFCNDLLRPERGPHSIGPRPDLEILKKVASAEPMGSRAPKGRAP